MLVDYNHLSVTIAKNAGFCFGVSRAVELVEKAASDNLFDKRTSAFKCLVDVYSHMFYYAETANSTNGGVQFSGSDEASLPYPSANDGNQRFYVAWCHGSMSPMYDNKAYVDDTYYRFYRGITNATYFMKNVSRCLELTDAEIRERSFFSDLLLSSRSSEEPSRCLSLKERG